VEDNRATPDSADADAFDGRHETAAERSDRNWNDILQELRVTQTGTQIISGFLLTLAFQSRFAALDLGEIVLYGILVALAAASTGLGLAAVALHRARFRHHDKPRVVTIASRLLVATVWVVAVLSAGVVLFIFDFVFGRPAGIVAGSVAAIFLLLFLLVIPRSVERREREGAGDVR
jgi:hypothetical protein